MKGDVLLCWCGWISGHWGGCTALDLVVQEGVGWGDVQWFAAMLGVARIG